MSSVHDTREADRIRDVPILTLAALLPREFSIDLIQAVTGERATAIIDVMEEGVNRGVLRQHSPGVYAFRDAEKRGACLSGFGEKEQATLHRRMADLIKKELSGNADMLPVLAHHLIHAVSTLEDCRALYETGESLSRSYSQEEAMSCYHKVIETLRSHTGTAADEILVGAVTRYARLCNFRADSEWIRTRIEEAISRTATGTQRSVQPLLRMHLARFLHFNGQDQDALEQFEAGWSAALASGNADVIHYATTHRMLFYFWQGRFQDVVRAYEEHAPAVSRYPRSEFAVSATVYLGLCLASSGQAAEGIRLLRDLNSYCRKIGDTGNLHLSTLSLARALMAIGHVEDAVHILEEARDIPPEEEIRYLPMSYHLLVAEAFALKQDYGKAAIHRGKRIPRGMRWVCAINGDGCNRFFAGMEADALYRFLGLTADQIIRSGTESLDVSNRGMAYLFRARRLRAQGRPPGDVLESLELSAKWLRESGDEIQVAKVRLDLARVYLEVGNREKARRAFGAAWSLLAPINPALIPEDLAPLGRDQDETVDRFKKTLFLARDIIPLGDRRKIVSHLLGEMNRLTGSERGAIFLVGGSSEPHGIELEASRNIMQDQVDHPAFGSSMDIIRKTIASGESRMVGAGHASGNQLLSGEQGEPFRSCFCLPLILGDDVVGVLYHDNYCFDSPLVEDYFPILTILASHVAVALDKARIHEEILELNRQLTEEQQYYVEEDRQRSQFDDLIGESPAMQRVFIQMNQVAAQDTTVLIQGETGVGKELVARNIHKHSARREAAFISADCSVLTDSLIGNELFGHEKGAFTGASSRKIGRFEIAHGGTLFLDEIGNLPESIQVKLLRVLETKEFQRVGGISTIQSDFRLLTATNRDLGREVEAGRFREDLYYRLNVFPITVPPLRERKEDIPALANDFLKPHSAKLNKPFGDIGQEEVAKLIDYPWPGNVRELRNMIERGAILSMPSRFKVPELTGDWTQASETELTSLAEMDRRHILRVLETTGGKIKGINGAARILDIPASTLYDKMRKS